MFGTSQLPPVLHTKNPRVPDSTQTSITVDSKIHRINPPSKEEATDKTHKYEQNCFVLQSFLIATKYNEA